MYMLNTAYNKNSIYSQIHVFYICMLKTSNWSKRMNIFKALDFSPTDSLVKNMGYILLCFLVFLLCTSPRYSFTRNWCDSFLAVKHHFI